MSQSFSLEDALQQLDDLVRQLERGNGSLDEALALFEQGQQLVALCQTDLDQKELRIQQILDNGSLAPFNR